MLNTDKMNCIRCALFNLRTKKEQHKKAYVKFFILST